MTEREAGFLGLFPQNFSPTPQGKHYQGFSPEMLQFFSGTSPGLEVVDWQFLLIIWLKETTFPRPLGASPCVPAKFLTFPILGVHSWIE